MRVWIRAEDNKRRTLQRSDMATAHSSVCETLPVYLRRRGVPLADAYRYLRWFKNDG
jgi:hypothetical protein